MRRYLIAVCLVLTVSPFGLFAQKVQTVSGEYLYRAPDNVTVEQARRTAVERAQLEALAEAFSTNVSQVNTTHVENRNGQTDMAFLSSGGSEIRGEWLENTKEPEIDIFYDQGFLCVRAKVWGRAREVVGSGVEIDARILRNGVETRFESGEFRSGDDLYLYFRTPTSGYLTVYLVDAEQQAYCLLPYMRDESGRVAVEHDVDYVFFSPQQAAREIRAIVDEYTMTCERGVEQNDIYVIFSTNEFAKPNDRQTDEGLPRELPFADFQQWLTRNRMKDLAMTVAHRTIVVKK